MNPVPISDELAARYPGFKRIVVAGPNGDLTNDGSSPDQAAPVEAMFGIIEDWPAFVVHERLDPEEAQALKDGALLQVIFYSPRMPVHSLGVVAGP